MASVSSAILCGLLLGTASSTAAEGLTTNQMVLVCTAVVITYIDWCGKVKL